jgi:chitinase
VLDSDGISYSGSGGFTREWDSCSKTPFLRSPDRQVVAYDDPESLGMKAAFSVSVGMMGVNLFDVTGDTDNWSLADGLIRGLSWQE